MAYNPYTPNWDALFGPPVQNAQNQATASANVVNGQGGGQQFGLGNWFQNLFRRQIPGSVGNQIGMGLGILPQPQGQTVYGTPNMGPRGVSRGTAMTKFVNPGAFAAMPSPQRVEDSYIRPKGMR